MDREVLREAVNNFSEDILPPYNSLMEIVGFDGICAISYEFGGTGIYIPTIKRLFTICVAKQIKKEFDGGNYKKLARKYELCERTVRSIVNGEA